MNRALATIVSLDPLEVVLDGSATAAPAASQVVGYDPVVGDRVFVDLVAGRLYIFSVFGFEGPDVESDTVSGVARFDYSNMNTLTVFNGAHPLYCDELQAGTFVRFRVGVGTPSAGASIIVKLRLNGTVIATVELAAGAKMAYTETFDVATFADGDYLTVDITQVGSTTPGAFLTASVIVTP